MTCDACKEKACKDKSKTCKAEVEANAELCNSKKFAKKCRMTCDACEELPDGGKPCKDKSKTCKAELEANADSCDGKKFKKKCKETCNMCDDEPVVEPPP